MGSALNERRAEFVYEGARIAAIAAEDSVFVALCEIARLWIRA